MSERGDACWRAVVESSQVRVAHSSLCTRLHAHAAQLRRLRLDGLLRSGEVPQFCCQLIVLGSGLRGDLENASTDMKWSLRVM